MAPDVLLTVPDLPIRPESADNVMESLPGAITEPPALTESGPRIAVTRCCRRST